MTLEKLLEYGNMLVKEQDNVKSGETVPSYRTIRSLLVPRLAEQATASLSPIDELTAPMDGAAQLPRPSDLSAPLRLFLTDQISTSPHLSSSPELERELRRQCSDLESSVDDLTRRLSDSIAAHAARSEEAEGRLAGVRAGLIDLRNCVSGTSSGGADGGRSEQILAEELPALAKEVSRVETVRAYAETALKLDNLIGDVEDAVSSSTVGKLRFPHAVNSEEIRMTAIESLKNIEDILTHVTRTRPQWARLISAVDHRVDRALAVLRPQAIADHRSLLVSLGWPPPLSGSNIANSPKELTNPLLTMTGGLKSKYCDNFLSLCHLQELQRRRKSRQLEGYNLEAAMRQPLWVIEELVTPIFLACERHFSKWIEKPEFIFALVYKITRDFVDSMDETLQPLIDRAMLAGYSCREEWISAMVTSLSTYLAKEIFSTYVGYLQDGTSAEPMSHARTSWLHLVDLMISFDKRTQSLITDIGLKASLSEDDNLQRVSALSVFCDRPDWLEIWAEVELGEVLDKLKSVLQDEKVWKTRISETLLMTVSEDYKSPAVSAAVLQVLSSVVDRCRPIPGVSLRMRFIRMTGAPVLREYIDSLFHRCQEADGLTALADDDALAKVSLSINAARYCESVLTEWCEDVFFLELETVMDEGDGGSCVFEEEIGGLKVFRKEWVDKISTVILRGFDARCRDFFRNKKQWQEKADGNGIAVSTAFIGALDYLQGKISKVGEDLNDIDFVAVWRSVASGVDQLVFSGVLMSNAKFHDGGVERLGGDVEVLFGVFAAWCLRPEGFFPRLSEGLKVLRMEEARVKEMLKGKERGLKDNRLLHVTLGEAEKIAKNRVFMG